MISLAKLTSVTLAAAAFAVTVTVSGAALADEKPADGTGSSASGRSTSAKKQLAVKRLVFARGIDGHEPQDAATSFSAREDRVYAFIEVDNPGGEDTVDVVFQPPSGLSFTVPLKVGASGGHDAQGRPRARHFRTWAFTRRAHDAGEWTVVVRAPQGKVLARQSFTVTK